MEEKEKRRKEKKMEEKKKVRLDLSGRKVEDMESTYLFNFPLLYYNIYPFIFVKFKFPSTLLVES